MRTHNQWIVCQVIPAEPKPRKIPIDPRTGSAANAHDPKIHMSYAEMEAARAKNPNYLRGFVFTDNDPYWFLDVDNCYDGEWKQIATTLQTMLPGALMEVSHSSKGLHFFGRGVVPKHACKNLPHGLEFYHKERFALITHAHERGDCNIDFTKQLPALIDTYFPPRTVETSADWTTEPDPAWRGPEDDAELLKRMLRSKPSANVMFGKGVTLQQLWEADDDALGKAFPDSGSRAYDASSADLALANHLAFWTGKNCDRIERMMHESELQRSKWDDRPEYLQETIRRAISNTKDVYKEREVLTAAPTPVGMKPKAKTGSQLAAASFQEMLFNGCVYVQDANRVFTPTGAMLTQSQFDSTYGGYSFIYNAEGKDTRKAWEAFTQSQLLDWPMADTTCFKPDIPPGQIVMVNGMRAVNTYVPAYAPRVPGDPGRFLDFLAKLLPDPHDRKVLLSYIAACVQHMGVKFQWAVLLQGVQGNGKTCITRCVAAAVGRKYTHMPKADQIVSQFNAWLAGNILIGVEDIYVPGSKADVIEILKPMITSGDGIEIQAKGVDQRTADICCNFIFNSNHKEAIRVTRNDRRFCVFYTEQQKVEHLERDGMGGDYFPSFYNWLSKQNGYAIVANYLATYKIPDDLNPAGACHRAPKVSSTDAAILESIGPIEQEVQEAVESHKPGFCGGWISSRALELLLDKTRLAQNKRKAMLEDLGYIPHPGLTNGRSTRTLMVDGGSKPRLFITRDHRTVGFTDANLILSDYETAQGPIK